jgi:hypothetical protein
MERTVKARLTLVVVLSCCVPIPSCLAKVRVPRPAQGPSATAECFEWVVDAMAADAMGGRRVGSEGFAQTASFIEREFGGMGLEPVAGGWRQSFQVITTVALRVVSRLTLGGVPVRLGAEFVPLGISSSGEFSGPLVFAGYGISAPEIGYDDYAGIDVQGKVVLAMRYEPEGGDPRSPFVGDRASRWSDLRTKARVAQEKGAQALLLMEPAGEGEARALPVFRQSGSRRRAALPVLQINQTLARRLVQRQGHDLASIRARIDRDHRPHSLELDSIRVSGAVQLEIAEVGAENVVGVLPGRGKLAHEVVVVGAHFDHLGMGGEGSRLPDAEAIHNGADDNASGVAAMLCGVAGALPSRDGSATTHRTLVLVAFGAEEIALGGSWFYVSEPLLPLKNTVAMVNLDMVGRLQEDRLQVLDGDSAPEWEALLASAAEASGLAWEHREGRRGPSSQTPFLEKRIPAIRLSTGIHEDHHTPGDDPEKLNVSGGAKISGFLEWLIGELLTRDGRLSFRDSRVGSAAIGDERRRGAYLGTIPDLTRISVARGGVALAAVTNGSPAAEAGILAGDRIVRMAGVSIENIEEMTLLLQDHRGGERMEIEVVRDGRRLRFWALLTDRDTETGYQFAPPSSTGCVA